MEASTGAPPQIPATPKPPDTAKIKRKLLQNGVYPTPKIIHNLRKKDLQKSLRKSKKHLCSNQTTDPPPLTESQTQALAEDSHFRTLRREYRDFNKAVKNKARSSEDSNGGLMVGKPWERLEKIGLREFSSGSKEYAGERLKTVHLRELSDILDERRRDDLRWVLDDDLEVEEGWLETGTHSWEPPKRRGGEAEAIRFLVDRLSAKELSVKDWKFGRMMKQSGLQFTEAQLLKIVGRLGANGQWRNALSVVEWVYSDKEHKHYKSRFVYTKVLSVLGKARRPHEALHIFNLMRGDYHIYPDMAAYHTISVTLGQAGLVKELVKILECMRQKPSIKNMRRKNWDPVLEPDLVVYNAVLNACVPTCQWKGVSWVFEQLRKSGLKPNGASYGLAMEVMLEAGKYDLVHEFFWKMRRSGEAPKALTYKVIVRAFWKEGKVDEAVEAVRNMEQRGVVGTACVYYELACCLCNKGRWQDAMAEVEKLKKLPHAKPLEVTFTGMIMSSMDGGYVDDCMAIFQQMKDHCVPNIGTINAMLKVYSRNDMFSEAKELFEDTKRANSGSKTCIDESGTSLVPDVYTYSSMLDASATALQWEYFEHVYKEMSLSGYQLDQSKHASLLVEASKAGKWHLLEHAFDTALEVGEIPHPSFFIEMICQATIQHDYERALTLVNALGHAPFQVAEKEWTELFEKNGDRISRDCLEKLLDALHNCQVAKEATILNLTKSLHSICGSGTPIARSRSIAFGNGFSNPSTLDDNGESDGFGEVNARYLLAARACENPNSGDNPLMNNSGIISDGSSINYAGSDTEDAAELISNLRYVCDEDRTNLTTKVEEYPFVTGSPNNSSKRLALFDNSKEDATEQELDILINGVGIMNGPNVPTADEILESWKEKRRKDNIFFPFQLGSK